MKKFEKRVLTNIKKADIIKRWVGHFAPFSPFFLPVSFVGTYVIFESFTISIISLGKTKVKHIFKKILIFIGFFEDCISKIF